MSQHINELNNANDRDGGATRCFVDYTCRHCGYAWGDVQEVAEMADCPNCAACELPPATVTALEGNRS
jgi:predicted Zn-ribbon and HTH transcriptional regulator